MPPAPQAFILLGSLLLFPQYQLYCSSTAHSNPLPFLCFSSWRRTTQGWEWGWVMIFRRNRKKRNSYQAMLTKDWVVSEWKINSCHQQSELLEQAWKTNDRGKTTRKKKPQSLYVVLRWTEFGKHGIRAHEEGYKDSNGSWCNCVKCWKSVPEDQPSAPLLLSPGCSHPSFSKSQAHVHPRGWKGLGPPCWLVKCQRWSRPICQLHGAGHHRERWEIFLHGKIMLLSFRVWA